MTDTASRFEAGQLDLDVTDAEEFHLACIERGWGDGLPMIPPTRERVEKIDTVGGRLVTVLIGE